MEKQVKCSHFKLTILFIEFSLQLISTRPNRSTNKECVVCVISGAHFSSHATVRSDLSFHTQKDKKGPSACEPLIADKLLLNEYIACYNLRKICVYQRI